MHTTARPARRPAGGTSHLDRQGALLYGPVAVKPLRIPARAGLGPLFGAAALTALLAASGAAPTRACAQSLDDERPPGQGGGERGGGPREEGPSGPAEPMRILASLGGGGTLRIVNDLALEQGRFAPVFLDVAGGVVFPARGLLRHGAHLQVSTNLSGEGPGIGSPNEAVGIDTAAQWTLTPSYLAYLRLDDTFVLSGRAGLNLTVSPYFVLGTEVAAGATFLLTAGLGLYAEASFNLAFGQAPEPLPTASLEVGLAIDYEVLP